MKRVIQIGVVFSLMLLGLSSGLVLNTGHAHSSVTDGQVFQLPAASPAEPQLQPGPVLDIKPHVQAETDSNRTVTVSGSGQVNARPDQAVIRVGVQTDAESAEAALSENSRKMQALLDSLEQAGVAPEDIQTTNIQLHPRYENQPEPQGGPPQVAG